MESEVCMTSHPTNAPLTPQAVTLAELDELQRLFDAATPGERKVTFTSEEDAIIYIDLSESQAGPNAASVLWQADWATGDDARLDAAAHNAFPSLLALARRAIELEEVLPKYLTAPMQRDDFARRCLEHMRLNLSTDGKGGYSLPEADTILAAVKADLAQKEHSHD
jgi:hypothetical protein